MPWFRRYRRRPWRRRFRFRRRFRKTFRTQTRRRRTRRVRKSKYRKRKLKKLILKQYQPQTIKKCKVKGIECLFLCNIQKIYFNYQMYEPSIVPEHLPGGGGWSAKVYSLSSLYDSFQLCRNVWTTGNHNLPLVRYLGCKFKLYQSWSQDYIFQYQNQYPMVSTIDTYCASQPSMLAMNNRSIKVPSKITQKRKKPYKIIRIRPPAEMQNKWYFQKEIAHIPLLLTYTSATSFDNYFASTTETSTNTNIYTLKTSLFSNTNFNYTGTSPYSCTKTPNNEPVYLYATAAHWDKGIKAGDLICLGNTKQNKPGYSFNDPLNTDKTWQNWKQKTQSWGNPFWVDYLKGDDTHTIYQSTKTWATITNEPNENNKITDLTPVDTLYEKLRYTPNRDNGHDNMVYFKPTTKNENGWAPDTNPDITNQGYPLWLLLWGYTDFVKRTQKLQRIETNYCLAIRTSTTAPTRETIVPINLSFIHGNSPFENKPNPIDYDNWYPSLQMQYEALNYICLTGPGTPKLGDRQTTEAKCEYIFYFKFGGSPPKMSEINDPGEQPTYTIPRNIRGATTIENPTNPIQSYIYRFDTKHDILTKKAAERIKKDWETDSTIFTDAKPALRLEQIYQTEKTPSKEKEKETLYTIIQQLQLQQYLKRRIHRQLTTKLPITL
nr:MAG: ORF1 [TTV-like mini virus]